MLDTRFDRIAPPSSVLPCQNPCKAAAASDEQLSRAAQARIESYTGAPEPATGLLPSDDAPSLLSADSSACRKKALTLGPTLRRFNRYRQALPYARAADDMNKLNDKPADDPPQGTCLTRLPDKADDLCDALHLPRGTIKDGDLRNDKTGFRAAMYKDEATGRLILVARDTEPNSLVDWQTNTRNGEGMDTDQYAAMRRLTRRLSKRGVSFDVAGYLKGGGLAQEAALVSRDARAYVFNSAGLHPNSLVHTGNGDFGSLESRTRAFRSEDDFLTTMNETTDPEQQIANVRFLRGELAGENRWLVNPMKIDHRNPERPDGKDDPGFQDELAAYLKELDRKIVGMEQDGAAGRPLSAPTWASWPSTRWRTSSIP
ncbi:MAG: hypothetical protein PHU46_02805 [Rhodocyclaceae bacterium]|nr:hypothetical protein [Rhodocyclaceae bacterium]